MVNENEWLYLRLPISKNLTTEDCTQLVTLMNEALEYCIDDWYDYGEERSEDIKLLNEGGLLKLIQRTNEYGGTV